MAMTVRVRWSGQGFGDLIIKAGVGVKVTWTIVLPEEVKLGFGVGVRSWGSGALSQSAHRGRTKEQNRKPGNRVSGRVCQHLLALRHHEKHLGGAE